jgi:hypothetical protein
MHIAVALGTFLLGGWVLDAPVEEKKSTVTEQPAAVLPLMPPLTTNPSTEQNRRRSSTSAEGDDQRRDRTLPGGQTPSGKTSRSQGRGAANTMPSSPTEPAAPGAEGSLGQLQAPTAGGPQSGATGEGESSTSATQPVGPLSPTADQRRPASSLSSAAQNPRPPMIGSAGSMVPPTTEKAFSTYHTPSGVSPWMNLFRRDNGGNVDNYTSLVRPELEQRKTNQQVRGDISGLQRNSRTQGMNLQQLNQQNRSLQGVGTPQFYMNYGNYYPYQGQGTGP